MKKILPLLIILSISLIGCFDIFSNISEDDTNIYVFMNVVMPKSIIEISGSLSGEKIDYNDLFGSDDLSKSMPKGTKITKIDTPLEVGYNIQITANKRGVISTETALSVFGLPYKKGNTCYINLYSDVAKSAMKKQNDITIATLASFKYTLVVSKTFINKITSASITNSKGTYKVSFYEMNDSYLIEVPLLYMVYEGAKLKIN